MGLPLLGSGRAWNIRFTKMHIQMKKDFVGRKSERERNEELMAINIDGGQSTNEFHKRCAFYTLLVYYLPLFWKANEKKNNI